ncbi:RNA polymerase-binding protein DksA [Polaromonas sp.]|uniref:RNA polymerase-binding protein DksA n=1 Tax=Polaromonas sp. TaxID=1869339 RepID=UPI00286B572F|nr:RNA polymerase-binding protein DksA [Polaromonas sp.]
MKAPAKKSQAAVKTASKKAAMKVLAKPAAKSAVKTATQAVAKPAVKAQPTAKKAVPSAQPAARAKATPVASKKAAAKPMPAKAQVAARPAAKPAAKPAAPSVKPKAEPVTTSAVKASAKPAAKDSKTPAKVTAPVASPVPASRPMLAPVRMASAPLKPGRRSSARTATHSPPPAPMVPTHAPDAAKASYSTMTERVIAPPIQAAAKKDPKLANNWKTTPAELLTDEEVKAMPDAEYMNEKQMAFFRHKLSLLKQDIHNNAGETTEHLREDTAVVPDPADRATIEEEHALELRTRDRERKLLKKIEQSIARIDSGDYGYCDETGEPIGVGRLIARPTANLSLEAQQRRELKQKMFGD